ncbi:N-acetylglucosamine 6-phosphate deacetylase [Paraglaciecola sp. T6c]|uniref:N-acetylglucosamine-6-phosphate deacetylase n=1 Tax=Pseudoalteromonas atlantica (strain T6c / ATCC BAA-1087) TaxID=3042615 RepID=UPI00005C7281|nr:N-acetylglucosamine-6-phosphate deacetylase [Paraglaciecola sp. T6c]ABG42673.1 N-acetylglucosamine 6-phosphate deacetylase [Paraglaciecola sp. T6c]
MQFRCERLLTSNGWLNNQTVIVEQDTIQNITATSSNDAHLAFYPGSVVPGFIDVQVNGGGGVLFNQSPTTAALAQMSLAHRKFGTTGLMPTLITDELPVMQHAAQIMAEAIDQHVAGILGVHFEGPHLSKPKKGVHDEAFIRPITDDELALYLRKDLGKVIVTLAPENVSPDVITQLCQHGVKVCLGHSNADAETVLKAIEAGADGFTHLFNAMSAMLSRAPGMVGVALNTPDTYAGLILDHYHIDPICSEIAIKIKGKERMMLVTDAMGLIGTDDDSFMFGTQKVTRVGNKLTTDNGTLAGSHLDMLSAIKNAVRDLHIPLEDAITMASTTPAHYLGLQDTHGVIAKGKKADFVVLDDALNITALCQSGQFIPQS